MRAHYAWRHVRSVAGLLDATTASSFALPGTEAFYPADRPILLRHLHLDVTVDPTEQCVFGACTMLCMVNAEVARVARFDASDLDIEQVVLDGASTPVDFRYDGRHLDVPLPDEMTWGRVFNVTVIYRVERPVLGLYFVGPSEGSPATPVQVWSQNQDDDARYWMPCIDDPGMKMTTSARVTVPTGMVALSNGVPGDDGPSPVGRDGWHAYTWHHETPQPIYLFSLLVGPFEEHLEPGASPEIRWYSLPGQADDAARAFGNTRKMVDFFEAFLGVPYRWQRYGQIAVDDFVFGGMENTTLTTVTTRVLPDERASLDFSADSLVAHELAHQWFGDLVTCRDWTHAWLNEGFATYFDALYMEHALGRDEFHQQLLELAKGYYQEDSGRYRRALITREFAEPIDIFDRHLYHKGAWVLHMLRQHLGDDAFRRGIRMYLERFALSQAETSDLQRAIEDATGRRIAWFFDQWLRGTGYPKLVWSVERSADSGAVTVTIEGAAKWDLRATLRLVNGDEVHDRVVRLTEGKHVVATGQAADSVVLDPDYTLLAVIEPRLSGADAVTLLKDPAVAVPRRLEAATRLASLGTTQAVRALGESLRDDGFWGLKAGVAGQLARLGTPTARRLLLDQLGEEAHPKARRAIVRALSEFTGCDDVGRTLAEVVRDGDASYFVEAEAATAVGRAAPPDALEVLDVALERDSFNEVIRCGALAGLGWLRTDEAIDRLVQFTERGGDELLRVAAVSALGRAARDEAELRPRVLDVLHGLRAESGLRLRLSLVSALETVGTPHAMPTLRAMANAPGDARIRRRAREAQRTIQAGLDRNASLGAMRGELDRLKAGHGRLKEQVERLRGDAGDGA